MKDFSNEELWVRYIASKDEALYNEIYRRFYHLVRYACAKYLYDDTIIDEVTNTVFLIIFNQQTPVQHVANWLHTVTLHECQRVQKRAAHTIKIDTTLILSKSEDYYVENEFLETLLNIDQEDQRFALETNLATLPTLQQQCLRAFYYDKKSYRDIARQLAIDVSEVKSALQNGKRKLKLLLNK